MTSTWEAIVPVLLRSQVTNAPVIRTNLGRPELGNSTPPALWRSNLLVGQRYIRLDLIRIWAIISNTGNVHVLAAANSPVDGQDRLDFAEWAAIYAGGAMVATMADEEPNATKSLGAYPRILRNQEACRFLGVKLRWSAFI